MCHNDAGELNENRYVDEYGIEHLYPQIHPDNVTGTKYGHIGQNGALRLAKAMWWMLARIAGWNGYSQPLLPGDANDDGEVDTDDIPILYDIILGEIEFPGLFHNANANVDTSIDILDITTIEIVVSNP